MILRGLVVFLACLNLGVALWWWLHRDYVPPVPPAQEEGTGTLVLLGEAEAPPPTDLADVGAVPVPMPAAAACLSIGPFGTPAELRGAMSALTPLVARIQFREVAAQALRGYRVYLPAAGNREEALAAARQLAARGVRDYYVVTAGNQQNSISLGLFRERANADRRRAEIAGLGFAPEVTERVEDLPVYWLDVAVRPDAPFDWRDHLPDFLGIRDESIACF